MKLLDKVLEKFGIVSKEFDKKFCETFETPLDSCIKDLEKDIEESSEKLERKIGEKFSYKGTMLKVTKCNKEVHFCTNCFFKENDCVNSRLIRGWCTSAERADNTEVYFEVIKETKEIEIPQQEGKKFDTNKLRYTLLPFKAVTEVVEVLEFGARKYGKDNWQKVPNARERYIEACIRHYVSYCKGETYDPESNKHHLAHATCCLLFILWFDLTGKKEEL